MYLTRWQLFVLKGRRLCEYLALARASTDEDKMQKLIWIRLMLTRMQNMRPFSMSSIRPLTEISINCCRFLYVCYCLPDTLQVTRSR